MQSVEVGNSRYIRDLNLLGIFKLITKLGPITRKQLADNTGYSAATISNHVKTLLEQGFVIETEKGHSTGGRKPVFLTVNPEKGYIFSVDIEVTRVKIVMFNLKLEVENKIEFQIEDKKNSETVLDIILDQLNKILEEENIGENKILGIGVAVPGLINKNQNMLEFAPNLGWRQIDIIRYFEDKLEFVTNNKNGHEIPIILENEANAAAAGEREFVYPDADNMVYVSVNEGIGCGIFINGELYRGASGNAGEFGHIIIDEKGKLCHCGNKGCWETLASISYLKDKYQALSEQKQLKLEDQLKIKNQLELEKIKQLLQVNDPNPQLIKIIQETGSNLGLGLANIINSLSPKLLIIGGDIVKFQKYIEKEIIKVVQEKSIETSLKQVEIEFTRLKGLAVVRGLASHVFNESVSLLKQKI